MDRCSQLPPDGTVSSIVRPEHSVPEGEWQSPWVYLDVANVRFLEGPSQILDRSGDRSPCCILAGQDRTKRSCRCSKDIRFGPSPLSESSDGWGEVIDSRTGAVPAPASTRGRIGVSLPRDDRQLRIETLRTQPLIEETPCRGPGRGCHDQRFLEADQR